MTTLVPKYDQGATGAINRPFNQKLAEIVSVKDFGAVGDGTTDDTVAIAAAVAATPNNGTVYFPPGVYCGYILLRRSNISIIGAGAASTTLKLPNNCPNITVPWEGGGNITGLPNVIEIGEAALGNTANIYTNVVIQSLSVDGNKANNPDVTRDLFGHGIIATKTSYCKIIDVNVSNCWVAGVILVINSNYGFVKSYSYNCGFSSSQPWYGFDVNSSKYGIFDVITESCNYGTRILDNCYANHLRASCFNTTRTAFVYSNQTVNKSYANNIEINIYGGCVDQGIVMANNCFNSKITANIRGITGRGMTVAPSAAAYSSTGNNISLTTSDCATGSLYTTQYDNFNIYTVNSVADCTSGVSGSYHALDIYGSNSTFNVNIKGLTVPNGRGFVFRPTASNNYLSSAIMDTTTLVSNLDDQGTGNVKNDAYGKSTIVSSTNIDLPLNGTLILLTGGVSISALSGASSYVGRVITLLFSTNTTVVNGSGCLLAGGINFSATANDTLTLVSNGTNWVEVSRSVN